MSKRISTQEKARRLWVRALRSGKYVWGKEALQPKDGRYCCLGVLCEVAIKHKVINGYDHSDEFLPDKVREWAGLSDDCGSMPDQNDSLSLINDRSERNPFKKIANIIEKNPDGLFVDEVQK